MNGIAAGLCAVAAGVAIGVVTLLLGWGVEVLVRRLFQ